MQAVAAAVQVRPAAVPTCGPQPRAPVAALRNPTWQQTAAAPRRQQLARLTAAAATSGWQRRRRAAVVLAAAGGASDLPHDFAERKERLESGSEDFSQLTQQIEVGRQICLDARQGFPARHAIRCCASRSCCGLLKC